MKNVIKKIVATAMAFTLLGTGTAVAKTINPKSDNTIVADAAGCIHNCRWYESFTEWEIESTTFSWIGDELVPDGVVLKRYKQVKCVNCWKVLSSKKYTKWVSNWDLARGNY